MAKVKVLLKAKTDIEFENDSLVSLSWEQQSTSDYSRPIYDLYPAYGQVVVKDKALKLYNMALKGDFDNYEYPVEIYVNNSIVGKFIITQLPVYSYDDKTLSFVIGDRLANADNITYQGYDYPLKHDTLRGICYDLLRTLDKSLTVSEISDIIDSTSFGGGTTLDELLSADPIPAPYIKGGISLRQAFRQFLTYFRMALISDATLKYRFVVIDKLENTHPNAIAIGSNQITSQFVPTIILPNKYNICEVASKKVVTDYHKDSVIATNLFDGQSIITINNVNKNKTEFKINASTAVEQACTEVYFNWLTEDLSYSSSTALVDELPILYNNNLNKIQYFEKVDNKNPAYQLTIRKTIEWEEGTVDCVKSGNTYRMVYSSFTKIDGGETGTTVEYINTNALSKIESFTYEPKNYNNQPVTVEIETNSNESKYNISQSTDGSKYINTIKAFLGRKLTAICAEFNQYLESGTVVNYEPLVAYKYTITYEFVNLSITYNGDYTQITFNDSTVTVDESGDKPDNKVAISNGGELVQYEGSNPFLPKQIATNVLNLFRNGLQGGQMQVIGWDYYGYTDSKKNTKMIGYTSTSTSTTVDKKKFFAIGDIVVPCKDRNRTAFMTRQETSGKTNVHFQVVKNAIEYRGGSFTQNLTLREVPSKVIPKLSAPSITLTNNKTITINTVDSNATNLRIYMGGYLLGIVTATTKTVYLNNYSQWYNLSNGEKNIYVIAIADGYSNSNASNILSVTLNRAKYGWNFTRDTAGSIVGLSFKQAGLFFWTLNDFTQSKDTVYSQISFDTSGLLKYGTAVAFTYSGTAQEENGWNDNMRVIVFDEPPTGTLLTFLTNNATKG